MEKLPPPEISAELVAISKTRKQPLQTISDLLNTTAYMARASGYDDIFCFIFLLTNLENTGHAVQAKSPADGV